MDTTNGSYMQYNNTNSDDLSHFFQDVEQYASLDNNASNQFDPALFADNGLASFSPQPTQQPAQTGQSNFNQAQRQTHSQSPALPQFKQTPNTYSSTQYAQNAYNQQSLGQAYDPHLLARPTPSPGPFDQYSYQPQNINYGHPSFNYQFNSFQQQQQQQQQRQQSATSTQAFRPQVTQQAQSYLSTSRPSPQPQAHVSQVQGANGMSFPYQQGSQVSHRFIEPSMLNADGQVRQNPAQMAQARQIESSPYFTMPGARMSNTTLDPRTLQMQHYAQLQQQQQPVQKTNLAQMNGLHSGHLHNMYQMQPQAASVKVPPMARTKKDGRSPGSASSSDDDLDIEEEEEPEQKPAVITIAKPSDERGKLLWETVEAVWTPRNKPAPAEKIRAAIAFVGNAVRGHRDKWKQNNEQLKQAELPNSATQSQAGVLKANVEEKRATMEIIATRIVRFGHPSIVRRLGENQFLLSALYSFLLDRATAEDHNSSLVQAILQLGTKLETVDEEQWEKVKWTKILVRFTKKSTNESKDFAQQIINNAKKATARKKAEAAGQGPASPSGSSSGQVAGVKRPREGSETIQQAKKAAVKQASKPLSVQLEERRKLKEKEKAAAKEVRPTKTTTNGTTPAAVVARPKVATAMPAKSSPFASLMSASKRPGTSLAERAATQKVEPPKSVAAPVKKEPTSKLEAQPMRPAPTAVPSSSFLGFLADMDKPKAETPKPKVEEDPNETAEARAKRLRKEERRKLRVSWKPDTSLVETRIFEHDIDEETGHEDSMMRDVGSTEKEGEMLKHRINIEDDDSDSDSGDDVVLEYYMPSEVDFSAMIGETKLTSADGEDHNLFKSGGSIMPESIASAAQDAFEEGKMMTMHPAGEQPDTPREPPDAEDDDDFSPVLDFGEPSTGQCPVRQREQAIYARRQAYQQPPQPVAGTDLASMLAKFVPQQQNTQSQQTNWLQALNMASQQQQSQPQQPNLQGFDLSTLMAIASQSQQQQQSQPAYQAPAPASQSAFVPTPNIAALLGSLQQPQAQSSGNHSPLPDQSAQFAAATGQKTKDGKKDKKRAGKSGAPLGPDGLPLNYKTKVCEFWLKGTCTKGDACTYRHDVES